MFCKLNDTFQNSCATQKFSRKQFRETLIFPFMAGKSKEDIRLQPFIVFNMSYCILFNYQGPVDEWENAVEPALKL